MTKKHQFLTACKGQTCDWLKACAENPSAYMNAMHVKLIYLALRKGYYLH